ncbi:family 4 glycosyl hydrolase [Luteipulveratus flavus]|uniref:6-phospho-beta-glucosidase n=1 Tax=Luteipulveratus flavus TaxID=3031728 RepID=A0ABT6C9U5_9MICO|nr:6-phospho-beta-glucosidase [Luteipulveratus sp. YIM 133296]MDF8265643.1 6-phospho-beta-glucosidase [Luteipulveratus sp. YIM 133296]
MKLCIIGGGSFRTPELYRRLQESPLSGIVTEVVLHDPDVKRLLVTDLVLSQLRVSANGPAVRTTTSLEDAVVGSSLIVVTMRVGDLDGRTADERIALDAGLLGHESIGAGGIASALRTVPVAVQVAATIEALAPNAWVANLTNPVGIVTEAMQSVLGDRVIGVCNAPSELGRRAARALGIRTNEFEYVGLNHLGWLRTLPLGRTDVLPALLADSSRLGRTVEGRTFGVDFLQDLGMIPNAQLFPFYFARESVAALRGAIETRGEWMQYQQQRFYQRVYDNPRHALRQWELVRNEIDTSYAREADKDGRVVPMGETAIGYADVTVALLSALVTGSPARVVLDVRNAGTLPWLPDDAVVEVPCTVDGRGPRTVRVAPLTGHAAGMVHQVKAVEQLTIRAAREGSERLARQALALHPLVDSVSVARRLLDAYRARIPSLNAVFA